MKKQTTAIILVLVITGLFGCEARGGVIRDAEGLVELRIENGAAKLSFDLDKWEKLYHIKAYAANAEEYFGVTLKNGPFPITGLSGRVKDACIGRVAALDPYAEGITMPAVLLLMEDGSLEWLHADPLGWFGSNPSAPGFESFGRLPWLKDIVSLSYEKDSAGEMTIIAKDKGGLRCDVRTFCCLVTVFDYEWVYEIGPAGEDTECIFLELKEDGGISVRKGLLRLGDAYVFYTGKYTVSPAGDKPVLSMELWDEWELDMSNPDFSSPPLLSGKYFFKSDGVYFTLDLSEGDPLHSLNGKPVKGYQFWQPDLEAGPGGDIFSTGIADEVLDIVKNYCEETINYLKKGMTAFCTGDYEIIDGNFCWKVALGTDHDENFVIEFIYAVDLDSKQVYRFDVLENRWIPLAMG